MAGWCNGSTSRSERGTVGSNPNPATITDWPPLFDVAKGGGEVNKKHACLLKRFAALVAALVLCLSLVVPCFASNNASSRKWVVRSEAQMTAENGTVSRFLELVPYENGAVYATPITTAYSTLVLSPSSLDSDSANWALMLNPINYPDWWRSSIPLGANSYVSFSNARLLSSTVSAPGISPSTSSFSVYAFTPSLGISVTAPYSEAGHNQYYFSGSSVFYPVKMSYDTSSSGGLGGGSWTLPPHNVSYGSSTATYLLQDFAQFCFSTASLFRSSNSFSSTSSGLSLSSFYPHYNASSDSLVFAVMPSNISTTSYDFSGVLSVSVEISFFVDANKLPAGLQVGDEFPADTDAFDKLREELIKKFPEASENIKNGKDTIQGWNNTETVDTDVASTSITVLNALFQNLGGFLFVISLMVFGAVVLRMLIRKAVDG